MRKEPAAAVVPVEAQAPLAAAGWGQDLVESGQDPAAWAAQALQAAARAWVTGRAAQRPDRPPFQAIPQPA